MKKNENHITPPRLAERVLLWFLKDELAEEVMGDLEEQFYQTLEKQSKGKAHRNYWYQVLKYIRPFALKRNRSVYSNQTAMFKHNILISFRSFKRFKSTFFINLIGLASGLACTLLIYLWVADEISMDQFHDNSDRLYQVMHNLDENGEIETITSLPGMLAETLMADFPEVESATMVWPTNFFNDTGFLSYEETQLTAGAQFVDNQFLKMMSFPLIEGDINTALSEKTNVLVSASFANKVFGTLEKVVGTTVHWNSGRASGDYLITGIFKELPKNSSMQFDMLMHHNVMMDAYKYMSSWGNSNPHSYVLLKEGVSSEDFNDKIESLIKTKVGNSRSTLFIQKFTDRYLHGTYENGTIAGGRIAYVQLFSTVALVILIIACINFMNLSTAKAAGRLKEIGIKKSLGAKRKGLIAQYYTESFLLTAIGTILAISITLLLLPQFNAITHKSLSIEFSLELMTSMLLLILGVGFLAGSYPALYLSGLKTTESLKGKIMRSFADVWARKGLVVFQFSASVILIVSVLIISQQIDYIQSKNLGYERDNVLSFNNSGISKNAYPAFLSQLESIPGVMNVSSAGHDLTGDHGSTQGVNWPGKQAGERVNFINLEMSAGFIETMGMEVVLGRAFERDRPGEDQKIIFNETAINQMGLEDPIGKTIKLWGNDEKEIIGVVRDFHAESLYEPIQPTFIQAYPMLNTTLVKLQAGTELEVIQRLESSYEEFSQGLLFESL